jgi:hypothetical protein
LFQRIIPLRYLCDIIMQSKRAASEKWKQVVLGVAKHG